MDDLYTVQRRIWQAADDAWQAELERIFGSKAGDARYDARGYSTPELRRLHDIRMAEQNRYYVQIDSRRAVLSGQKDYRYV